MGGFRGPGMARGLKHRVARKAAHSRFWRSRWPVALLVPLRLSRCVRRECGNRSRSQQRRLSVSDFNSLSHLRPLAPGRFGVELLQGARVSATASPGMATRGTTPRLTRFSRRLEPRAAKQRRPGARQTDGGRLAEMRTCRALCHADRKIDDEAGGSPVVDDPASLKRSTERL